MCMMLLNRLFHLAYCHARSDRSITDNASPYLTSSIDYAITELGLDDNQATKVKHQVLIERLKFNQSFNYIDLDIIFTRSKFPLTGLPSYPDSPLMTIKGN